MSENEDLIAEITQAVEKVDIEEDKSIGELVEEVAEEKVEEKTEEETTEETVDITEEVKEAEETTTGDEVAKEEGREETTGETTEDIPVISDAALTRAIEVGIPLADARNFPSEGSLLSITNRMEAAARSVVETEKEEEAPEDPFANLPKLDPEVHDAEVIALHDKMVGIAKQQQETIQDLQDRQGEESQLNEAAALREIERQFDNEVDKLGEDFSDALGTGQYTSLDRNSQQFVNREAIGNQMSVMAAGYGAMGMEMPPFEELFETAAGYVLRDEFQRVREKGLTGKLKKRSTQHIQRAGGKREVPQESPEEEAARLIDEKFSV